MRRAPTSLLVACVVSTAAWVSAGPNDRREPDPTATLISAWKDGQLVVPRGLPAPWIPPSNPPTEAKIALGRKLFFEKSLSRDRSKSCAHCHDPELAFGDRLPKAVGVRNQVGPRNVPSLVNAAIAPTLFWDGRAVSLEAQAEGPLLAVTELDMTEELLVERIREEEAYAPLFEAAFGTPTITLRRAAHALASFERTLLAGDAPFDAWWFGKDDAALSAQARRGYEVFRTKGGCAGCHSIRPAEAAFSDFEFHATGAGIADNADLGRFAVTGRPEDKRRFRTPSLRNVAHTAPYFHDGSASTLRDVIEHYDLGGRTIEGVAPEISALHLTGLEKADLEAFLRALSSPILGPVAAPVPVSPPRPSLAARGRSDVNPRAIRLEACDRLERDAGDADALTALLVTSTRLDEPNLLDDAIERTKPLWPGNAALRREAGIALVHRARLENPPDTGILKEAEKTLAENDVEGGDPVAALELGYARHLLGDRVGARSAYERAVVAADEAVGERALAGLRSLLGGTVEGDRAVLESLYSKYPSCAVVLRATAEWLDVHEGSKSALALLDSKEATGVVRRSPRTWVVLAGLLRRHDRHADASAHEHAALAAAPTDRKVVDAVEALWREHRPIASFDDCEALDRDFATLFHAVTGDPWRSAAYRNDLGFRFREVVSTYAWRAEGRTQQLAEGTPSAAERLLVRSVELYEEAVAAIPKDVADLSFGERWNYAAILNDAALMRHYWLDVRDLGKAEANYLRAFDLTDGAYMDTYFYNLQYLYGFELPGHEDTWYRLARRASERILKESSAGLVPDDMKREAARRDAEALSKVLDARTRAPSVK